MADPLCHHLVRPSSPQVSQAHRQGDLRVPRPQPARTGSPKSLLLPKVSVPILSPLQPTEAVRPTPTASFPARGTFGRLPRKPKLGPSWQLSYQAVAPLPVPQRGAKAPREGRTARRAPGKGFLFFFKPRQESVILKGSVTPGLSPGETAAFLQPQVSPPDSGHGTSMGSLERS